MVAVAVLAALATLALLFKPFFGGLDGFWEGLRYAFMPNVISSLGGEWPEHMRASLKFGVWIACGMGVGLAVMRLSAVQPSAESSYATPVILVARVKSALRSSPPDTMGFLDLVHPETPLQERILRWERLFREPIQIRDSALVERFGVYSSAPDPFPIWPMDTMTLTSNEELRAEFSCSDLPREGRGGRKDRTLYMIKLDDRWWISGYSFEYLDEYSSEEVDRALRGIEEVSATRHGRAVEFADAVRSGRFASFEEADAAWIRGHW